MDKKCTVLLIDDEEDIPSSLRRTFRVLGHCDVLTTTSPKQVLEIVAQRKIDLIISDHRMPEMEGVLLKKVKEISPDTVRILLSGYSDFDALIGAINEGEVFRFISKPWDNNNLMSTVQMALKQRDTMKFVGSIVNKLQLQVQKGEALKVETSQDARNVRIRMEVNDALVSQEETLRWSI